MHTIQQAELEFEPGTYALQGTYALETVARLPIYPHEIGSHFAINLPLLLQYRGERNMNTAYKSCESIPFHLPLPSVPTHHPLKGKEAISTFPGYQKQLSPAVQTKISNYVQYLYVPL